MKLTVVKLTLLPQMSIRGGGGEITEYIFLILNGSRGVLYITAQVVPLNHSYACTISCTPLKIVVNTCSTLIPSYMSLFFQLTTAMLNVIPVLTHCLVVQSHLSQQMDRRLRWDFIRPELDQCHKADRVDSKGYPS